MKPYLTYEQQLDLMLSRGLVVHDRERALDDLSDLNYYHLRGFYIDLMDDSQSRFKDGTTFEQIVKRAEADRRLRNLLVSYIGIIEQRLRTAVGHTLGEFYGPTGYLSSSNFYKEQPHHVFLHSLQGELRRSNEDFVEHHKVHYDGVLPAWVMVELLSLGTLSKLAGNMQRATQRRVAEHLGVHERIVFNQLRAITVVRNLCAHHGKLYGRRIHARCEVAKADQRHLATMAPDAHIESNTVFAVVLAMSHLLRPSSRGELRRDLVAFSTAYPRYYLPGLGFVPLWENLLPSN